MPTIDRAFEINEGVLINSETGGPFITGGTADPTGLDLPVNTLYVQQTTKPILWIKHGVGVNDWRPISSSDIPNQNLGDLYKDENDSVEFALQELRRIEFYEPLVVTSAGAGTLNVNDTNSVIYVEGTAVGYSVNLPDATTLAPGFTYNVVNRSTEQISVKDGASGVLFTLNSGDDATLRLLEASTAAGDWATSVVSTTADGIQSYNIVASAAFATSATSDVLVTGLSVLPVSGRYAAWYSGDISISTNNRVATCTLYKDGVAVTDTLRDVQGVSSNFNANQQTLGIIEVDGTQTIDLRVRVTGGVLTVTGRTLLLIRLGSV